VTYNTVSTDI